MLDSEGFRGFLQQQMLERCRRNTRYSLRSFARTLDIESSTLSKLLSGKRRISEKTMRRLSDRLGLPPSQRDSYFLEIVSVPQKEFRQISQDVFAVIADWYHYALIELARTIHFSPDRKTIASRLGLPVAVINAALERLSHLGMIRMLPKGSWEECAGNMSTIDKQDTSIAMREHERQLLKKAIDVLEELPARERDQSSLTLAFNARRLDEARTFITRFRRSFDRQFGADAERDEVFQLSISFFPLTRSKIAPKRRPKRHLEDTLS